MYSCNGVDLIVCDDILQVMNDFKIKTVNLIRLLLSRGQALH